MGENRNYDSVRKRIKKLTRREISVCSIDPYIIFFSIGRAKKERKEQAIAEEVAEVFSHPDSQIWINFSIEQQKWVIKIEADTIKAVARKIKVIFGKYILPEMIKEYKNCLAKPSTVFLTLIN